MIQPENLAKLLGQRLREIRTVQGLRQQDLEGRGISYKYYQRIEAGKVNLTLKSIEKLAQALKVPVLDLFREPIMKTKSLAKQGSRKTKR